METEVIRLIHLAHLYKKIQLEGKQIESEAFRGWSWPRVATNQH